MPDTFTLVATQVGPNMNYVLSPLVSAVPLTSSFTIPVNPVPNDYVGGGAFDLGVAFQVGPPANYLLNGVTRNVGIFFYNVSQAGGGIQASINTTTSYYLLLGAQLYSGPENAPTMLAGTFTLTLVEVSLPPAPNVYKVNYHFEINGRRSSPDLCNYVAAPSQDYNDVLAVLASNNLMQPGALVIDGVQTYNQAVFA